jgi:hypothetical protein
VRLIARVSEGKTAMKREEIMELFDALHRQIDIGGADRVRCHAVCP